MDKAEAHAEQAALDARREREQQLEAEQQQLRALAISLDRAAHEDALTGLHNHRHADLTLPLPLERARQGGLEICVAMLDVDHFKRINDRFGHGVGDLVLQQLGERLRQEMRGAELLARIGGQEFLLVRLGLPVQQMAAICERLREAVSAHDWEATAAGLQVRVSIGIAGGPPMLQFSDLLDQADAALYAAKRAGRDRVHVQYRQG